MTNKEFLKRASHLQKEYAKLYADINSGLAAIREGYIHVTAQKFHELEREGLLQHISKKLDGDRWDFKAMTPEGVKVVAIEHTEIEDKR